ncbi:MAG: hypothetical protein ABFC96_09420 [Thermoguttaceae bacterium]
MFRQFSITLCVLCLLASTSQFLSPTAAVAATATWAGGGGDNNWTTVQNWNGNVAPLNDGTADILFAGSTRLTPNVDLPWTVNSLTFGSSAGAFTLGGGPLTIQAGGVTRQGTSSNRHSLAGQVALGADQTWDTGNGYINLGSSGSLNTNGHTLTVTGQGMQFLGAVTGSGSVVISTTGYVCLWGTNSFSGGVVLNSGTLDITSDQGLGASSSPITLNGGVLFDQGGPTTINRDITLGPAGSQISAAYSQWQTMTISGNIHGPGCLKVTGGGGDTFLKLTGHNTYTGGNDVDRFTLLGTTDSIQGNVLLRSNYAQLEFQQDVNGVFNGNISGPGELLKFGSGVVTLTGNNTFSSDTQLYDGALEVRAGTNNLSPNSRLVFELGGTVGGVVQFVGGTTFTRGNSVWNGAGGFSARDGKLTVNIGGNGAQFTIDPITPLIFGSSGNFGVGRSQR